MYFEHVFCDYVVKHWFWELLQRLSTSPGSYLAKEKFQIFRFFFVFFGIDFFENPGFHKFESEFFKL